MFVRGYLRASTEEQDATRARDQLAKFAELHGMAVAAWYVENESGTRADRPELMRLLADAHEGDVLLIEAVDRLTRLQGPEWAKLRSEIAAKGLRVVALDLPTSHAAIAQAGASDEFTQRMIEAMNGMMLDVLAAVARKDYEQRRQRQAQGIERAKAEGVYKGRSVDHELRGRVRELLAAGFSIRKAARVAGCSPTTVQRVKADMQA